VPGRLSALEGLRGLAALYVVFHHLAHLYLARQFEGLPRLFVFGQVAVIGFFILSGFVIHYSCFAKRSDLGLKDYAMRRFRRIYPLYFMALALGFLCVSFVNGGWAWPKGWDLLGGILMLQDHKKVGNWFHPLFGNSATWTLSYEWFFYMAYFPIAKVLVDREAVQKYVVAGVCFIGLTSYLIIPNQISLFMLYFPVWWAGVELAREYCRSGRITWLVQAPSLVILSVLAIAWYFGTHTGGPTSSAGAHPMLELRHFLTGLVLLLIGIAGYKLHRRGLALPFEKVAWLGTVSYALYVFHLPILYLTRKVDLTGNVLFDFMLWVAPLLFLLAYLAERKLQPRINRWLSTRDENRSSRPSAVATLRE